MTRRLADFTTWKVGGSFALAALLAEVIGLVGVALVLALIGAALLTIAALARRRARARSTERRCLRAL